MAGDRVVVTYDFIPSVGWEGSHSVPFDAPMWATINTIMAQGEQRLNEIIDRPSQFVPWEETRALIEQATAPFFFDVTAHGPRFVLEWLEKHHGPQPFGLMEVSHYQYDLREARGENEHAPTYQSPRRREVTA